MNLKMVLQYYMMLPITLIVFLLGDLIFSNEIHWLYLLFVLIVEFLVLTVVHYVRGDFSKDNKRDE